MSAPAGATGLAGAVGAAGAAGAAGVAGVAGADEQEDAGGGPLGLCQLRVADVLHGADGAMTLSMDSPVRHSMFYGKWHVAWCAIVHIVLHMSQCSPSSSGKWLLLFSHLPVCSILPPPTPPPPPPGRFVQINCKVGC
jgi:hypothetical protein